MDIITIRGKDPVLLSTLIKDLTLSPFNHYKEVIMGCCRTPNVGKCQRYELEPKMSKNYIDGWPALFMSVYQPLKYHPALIDSFLSEYHYPATKDPIKYIQALREAGDELARKAMDVYEKNCQIILDAKSANTL